MNKFKKVFLIDDSNASNFLNESLLKQMGLTESISKFSKVEAALKVLKMSSERSFPELIFLDLSMPGYDGFDFLESFFELELVKGKTIQTKIIVLSNHVDFDNFDRLEAYKDSRIIKYFTKPLSASDVLKAIE